MLRAPLRRSAGLGRRRPPARGPETPNPRTPESRTRAPCSWTAVPTVSHCSHCHDQWSLVRRARRCDGGGVARRARPASRHGPYTPSPAQSPSHQSGKETWGFPPPALARARSRLSDMARLPCGIALPDPARTPCCPLLHAHAPALAWRMHAAAPDTGWTDLLRTDRTTNEVERPVG